MSPGRRKTLLWVGILVAAVLVGTLWLATRPGDEDPGRLVASGTLEATEAQLGFQAPGRIEALAANEGDRVTRGDTLALLERTEMRARREQAEARVAAARAALRELERGFRREEVAQAVAARNAARERLADAERDLERTRQLYEGGAVSREAYDKAVLAVEVARSRYEETVEQVKLLESGPRQERIEAQRAQLAEARASLRVIDAALTNMVIIAPFDGVVTVRHRQQGETVAAGTPVLTLMNPDDRWVRIYVREDRIGSVHLGLPASITTDTYPEKEYGGEVIFIASEAEFTPKNVQTTEERVKLVYAVKVQVTNDPSHDLKPGMPADVRIALDAG